MRGRGIGGQFYSEMMLAKSHRPGQLNLNQVSDGWPGHDLPLQRLRPQLMPALRQ